MRLSSRVGRQHRPTAVGGLERRPRSRCCPPAGRPAGNWLSAPRRVPRATAGGGAWSCRRWRRCTARYARARRGGRARVAARCGLAPHPLEPGQHPRRGRTTRPRASSRGPISSASARRRRAEPSVSSPGSPRGAREVVYTPETDDRRPSRAVFRPPSACGAATGAGAGSARAYTAAAASACSVS